MPGVRTDTVESGRGKSTNRGGDSLTDSLSSSSLGSDPLARAPVQMKKKDGYTQLQDFPDEGVDEQVPLEEEVNFIAKNAVKDPEKSARTDTSGSLQSAAKKAVKEDEGLSQVIHAAGWSREPSHTKAAVNARFPKGPPLSGAEWEAIVVLSGDPKGVAWLNSAGMFSVAQAQKYLDAHNFRDFNMLHRAQKIMLGKMAFEQGIVDTPPFWIGRSMIAGDKTVDEPTRKRLKGQIDQDLLQMWAVTLEEAQINSEARSAILQGAVPNPTDTKAPALTPDQVQTRHTTATAIMRKVFVLLQSGLAYYQDGEKVDYEGPVAKALSHGGRVNVRIPKLAKGQSEKDDHQLMDWLGITQGGKTEGSGAVFERAFGTHHMTVKADSEDGKKGMFREDGGKMAALKSKIGKTELYGMNLAIGGIGKKDFNGDVVLPDGAHGHLFIGFLPPNHKRDGALQVGVETTGPHAPSTVGYVHNWNSTEATANPISSVGGLKQDKVGEERMVDLNDLGGDWMGQLTQLEKQLEGVKAEVLAGPRVKK